MVTANNKEVVVEDATATPAAAAAAADGRNNQQDESSTSSSSSSSPPILDLTPKNLLDLCNLNTTSIICCNKGGDDDDDTTNIHCCCKEEEKQKEVERQRRFHTIQEWHMKQPKRLSELLWDNTKQAVDTKTGCFPIHWAAGTGFDEVVSFLLMNHNKYYYYHYYNDTNVTNKYKDDNENDNVGEKADEVKGEQQKLLLVNQQAMKPSTGRTPLHYAARNGHLSTCRLLIETYEANSNPKCLRGSVTPLQLAVWQNQFEIVQYLVNTITTTTTLTNNDDDDKNNHNNHTHKLVVVVKEVNDFSCGLNHWIGLIPKTRWLSKDGSGVLPLAHYLYSQGISYTSTSKNQQNQGHTPLHKAAWGGNIALMEYYRDVHNVYDTVQDITGNYATDLAIMNNQISAQQWLLQQGSLARQRSCTVLRLPITASKEEIQIQYKLLAKQYHPDKLLQQQQQQRASASASLSSTTTTTSNNSNQPDDSMFVKIKAAYEHLIYQDGIGTQRNPKHDALQLLTMAKKATATNKNDDIHEDKEDDDMFQARILTIISDYNDKGFPISTIVKRWNQIWGPTRPFPYTPDKYMIQVSVTIDPKGTQRLVSKKVGLLKFLKWKCQSVVLFRKINGVELAFQRERVENREQQQRAATESSNREQQQRAATESSNREQQQRAATESSNREQQQKRECLKINTK